MKYENAADVLPADLLAKVQKFAAGKLLYIPEAKTKAPWGAASGEKSRLAERNREIRARFRDGTPIAVLAEACSLSEETVRKIIYAKVVPQYRCTASSAKEFARDGRLEEWIHTFLLSDGHNRAFSDGLKLVPRFYHGPMDMPIRLFRRCCGPEPDMKYHEPEEWFEKRVNALREALQTDGDFPPLIVNYVKGEFVINDGNHRYEALRRIGREKHPVIFWVTEKEDNIALMEFLAREEPHPH